MKMKLFICTLTLVIFAKTDLVFADTAKPLVAVAHVDLDKYQGLWYEIATLPNPHMKKCVSGVTSEYKKITGGLIQILNSCVTADGSQLVVEGRAKVADAKSNAKLKTTYVHLFDWMFSMGGESWIIELDQNYDWAVMGDPSREYGRILSRSPYLSKYRLGEIDKSLKVQGYDTCKFITTIQKDGLSEKIPLCTIKSFFNRF